jgi:hypothetical protein
MMKAALVFLALATGASEPSEGIKVTTDRTVDTSSLEAIVRDVVRLSGAKTNDEKAIAIHTWLHQAIFHHAYPVEKSPQSVGPLKAIRVYGWGLCGGQHTMLKALFETAGWKVRYRGWDGHTTIEVFYDDRWHYFDVFLKCYFWTKDRKTIAGQDDINADPSIVLDAQKEGRVPPSHYLCCGDDAKGIVDGCKTSKPLPISKHEDGWASVTGRDRGYNPLLTLPAGATLKLEWKGEAGQIAVNGQGRHTCGNKDFRSDKDLGPVLEHYGPRNHSNGRLSYAPEFSRAGDVAGVALSGAEAKDGKLVASAGQGVALFKLPLPVVYVSGQLEAAFDGEGKLSISGDGGKTWQPAAAGDVSPLLKQKYDVQVKAEFAGALSKLRLNAVVEHNRSILPHLLPGKNVVTVAAPRNVVVTYGYQEATAPEKRSRWDEKGVTYSATKTASQEGAAPSWTIDVAGNTPPKMLYLEFAAR